jgi:hypothetical protein
VREPIGGGGGKKWSSQVEAAEFVFPKKFSKLFKPIFTQAFDWDAKEGNGTITLIFTPKPPASNNQGPASTIENIRLHKIR